MVCTTLNIAAYHLRFFDIRTLGLVCLLDIFLSVENTGGRPPGPPGSYRHHGIKSRDPPSLDVLRPGRGLHVGLSLRTVGEGVAPCKAGVWRPTRAATGGRETLPPAPPRPGAGAVGVLFFTFRGASLTIRPNRRDRSTAGIFVSVFLRRKVVATVCSLGAGRGVTLEASLKGVPPVFRLLRATSFLLHSMSVLRLPRERRGIAHMLGRRGRDRRRR